MQVQSVCQVENKSTENQSAGSENLQKKQHLCMFELILLLQLKKKKKKEKKEEKKTTTSNLALTVEGKIESKTYFLHEQFK